MIGKQERVQRESEMTDKPWKSIQGTRRTLQIDKLVYELYVLSEEEIRIVEGTSQVQFILLTLFGDALNA
mgnify:CR=1 FL=1